MTSPCSFPELMIGQFFLIGATRAQFNSEKKMNISRWVRFSLVAVLSVAVLMLAGSALAADHVSGHVILGGAPVANSVVTLWEASAGAPKKLVKPNRMAMESSRFAVQRMATPFCI